MKTSELLRKAADEIRRRGWYQGEYGSDHRKLSDCSVCSLGAISAGSNPSGNPWPAGYWGPSQEDAASTLAMVVADDRYPLTVVDWNDTEGRTVEEVLDAFERAAVAAELEES